MLRYRSCLRVRERLLSSPVSNASDSESSQLSIRAKERERSSKNWGDGCCQIVDMRASMEVECRGSQPKCVRVWPLRGMIPGKGKRNKSPSRRWKRKAPFLSIENWRNMVRRGEMWMGVWNTVYGVYDERLGKGKGSKDGTVHRASNNQRSIEPKVIRLTSTEPQLLRGEGGMKEKEGQIRGGEETGVSFRKFRRVKRCCHL